MKRMQKRELHESPGKPQLARLGVLTLVVVLGFMTTHVSGTDTSRWEDWSKLRMKARKALFFSGIVTLEKHQAGDWLYLRTETEANFMGGSINSTKTRTKIDANGKPKSYESRNKRRGRLYTFEAKGFKVARFKPADEGWEVPLSKWNKTGENYFEYPKDAAGKPRPVVDYYTMILSLAASPLNRVGDTAEFHVATSDGPQAYNVKVSEEKWNERPIRDKSNKKVYELRKEFRLTISPVDPDNAKEGFLSMEGETELWVDAKSKTLIELSGKIPKVPGQVVLTLDTLY